MREEHERVWNHYGCMLMSDGWSDRRGRHLIKFLVNSPEGTYFLESVDASSEVHDAFVLADLLGKKIGDKPTHSGSNNKKKDGKKKMCIKKIIYYDSNTFSSSPSDDSDEDLSSKKKTVNQNYSFVYSRMPYNWNKHLLQIPLGKSPHFDGEDYSFWSHKMHSHLFSLHPSIWEIVENGMHFDNSDNPVFINEQIHKNAQATTVLLASLCRDEYNKVSGLDNAEQIWDTLKISHEGIDATMITKMEPLEGELGIFIMNRGEEPTETYNRLKTLVNKIWSYGSTRWTNHDVVQLMLR
jgi:hypothetical protein